MEQKQVVETKICENCNKSKKLTSFAKIEGEINKNCMICVVKLTNPEDPTETKLCVGCNKQKKLKSFGRSIIGTRSTMCNSCKSMGKKIPREPKVKQRKIDSPLALGNIGINDYLNMYKFLESIGYTLSHKEDIHEQFCLKYNLKPKSPKRIPNNYYSQKDCGLI